MHAALLLLLFLQNLVPATFFLAHAPGLLNAVISSLSPQESSVLPIATYPVLQIVPLTRSPLKMHGQSDNGNATISHPEFPVELHRIQDKNRLKGFPPTHCRLMD